MHVVCVPGEDGGVEVCDGPAIGVRLDEAFEGHRVPWAAALGIVSGLAEILAILEDDGQVHGAIGLNTVFVDDTGAVSLEGPLADGTDHAVDRYGLGCIALATFSPATLPAAAHPTHEDAVLDALVMADFGDLPDAMVGDLQWFVGRLLSSDPEQRPDPVEVWRSVRAFSQTVEGDLVAWARCAVDGVPPKRSVELLDHADIAAGPLLDALEFSQVDGTTAYVSPKALRAALKVASDDRPAAGGGEATSYWTREQLELMENGADLAPRPQRAAPEVVARRTAVFQRETVAPAAPAPAPVPGPVPDPGATPAPAARRATAPEPTVFVDGAGLDADTPTERRQFRIDRCLGRGGFGEVYLATMRSPGGVTSQVAVKVLREGIDPRAQAVRRLRDEARVLGTLNHPSILTARDLVLLDGRVAMVMEFVPGADLDTCIESEEPPSLRAVLEVLACTAEALDAAWNGRDHDGEPLHLIHRDVKPSNIRIGQHGQVKLLDFGIAKVATEREAKTQVNQLIGTFSYMSPERMSDAVMHPTGDVYALGAILYECIAHELIWEGMSQRQQFKCALVGSEHDAYLRERVDALDTTPAIRTCILDAMAFDPEERPAALQFGRRLEELADDLPGRTLRRWCRDHVWPVDDAFDAALVGRTITEGRAVSSTVQRPSSLAQSIPPRESALEPSLSDVSSADVSRPSSPVPTLDVVDERIEEASDEGSWAPYIPLDDDTFHDDVEYVPRSVWPARFAVGAVVFLLLVTGSSAAVAYVVLEAINDGTVAEQPSDDVDDATDPVDEGTDVDEPAPGRTVRDGHRATDKPGGARRAVAAADVRQPASAAPDPVVDDAEPDAVPMPKPGPLSKPDEPTCDPVALELRAVTGDLTSAERACLDHGAHDEGLKLTERRRLSRVTLVDALERCTSSTACTDYERHQRYHLAELDQSDPDMMLAFARYLFDRQADQEAGVWAGRALERASDWRGRERTSKLRDLRRIRAVSATRLLQTTDTETQRDLARDAAVAYAELLRKLNVDASEAMELCAAATGSTAACDKRVSTEAVTEDVLFTSMPSRMLILVDGASAGRTPVTVKLAHGAHVLAIEGLDNAGHSIQVGGGEPSRWQWRQSEAVWRSWR